MFHPLRRHVVGLIAAIATLGAVSAVADDAAYVGSDACARCHQAEHARWRGSHHDVAMQPATGNAVLGDFADASFTYHGRTARFRTREGTYYIESDGPDGTKREYPVAYTFGAEPLQQYLIALPGGRLQAHNLAWDARPTSAGGQRWFHLHPDEAIQPGDVLHWTGPAQTWNLQCAECHSTNVQKGYDVATKAYATTWSEIDVACEACHGPGAAHVQWASAPPTDAPDHGLTVRLGDAGVWTMNMETGIAERSQPRRTHGELDTCAPCHSRRSLIDTPRPGGKYLSAHRPSLLEAGLYHADGQVDDEVYVYGSFVQSKMYAAGVTCSDCHDPHALSVRGSADAVCATCHLPAKFDAPAHHFHPAGSAGASCVACHMPSKRYMVVDDRRDHGFRVPRPDLGAELGTPNPCLGCHTDRDAKWAATTSTAWWPALSTRRSFAPALASGRRIAADAEAQLLALTADGTQPAIARATALTHLGASPTAAGSRAITRALADEDPLVRTAAADAAASLGRALPTAGLLALLADPSRVVRITAGRTLAPLLGAELPAEQRTALQHAVDEYRHSQTVNADRPDAHVNLGLLSLDVGDTAAAERHYRRAIDVGPYFIPAHVNLADVLRARGRDDEGEQVLRAVLATAPDAPDVHHALGLLLVRSGRQSEALAHLERAATLAPHGVHYAYVYGVALHSTGNGQKALAVLRASHERHAGHMETLVALATISRDTGAHADALTYAERLVALDPTDPQRRALRDRLRAAAAN